MAGGCTTSGAQVLVCAQSKSLGHSTLNEKVTCDSCRSKPVATACPVGSVSDSTYGEKSPATSVPTTRMLARVVSNIGCASTAASTTRSAGGITVAVATCVAGTAQVTVIGEMRTPPVMRTFSADSPAGTGLSR